MNKQREFGRFRNAVRATKQSIIRGGFGHVESVGGKVRDMFDFFSFMVIKPYNEQVIFRTIPAG